MSTIEKDLESPSESQEGSSGEPKDTSGNSAAHDRKVEWSAASENLDFVAADESLQTAESLASDEANEFHSLTEGRPEELSDAFGNPEILEDEAEGMPEIPAELAAMEAADIDDSDPAPTEFVEADQLISIIESLLFSTDKPVSTATFKQLFKGTNIRTKDITRALDHIASDFADAKRGVTLEEINGGYQLRTKVDNSEFLRRLAKVRPFRLSGPALEVMAIVAYKQPVTKHEIDEIRGVESGHLLRALMERGLVNFGGKSDLPGKPMTYGSTRKFLEIFGLRNLNELPTLSEIDELLPQGIGEVEEKESLSELTERMSNELSASYSEGEEELSKINEELQGIDTTSEFFAQEKQRERDKRDREKAQDLRERLMVGEAVEEKDRRWLDRYEAKLQAMQAAADAGTPISISADEIEAGPEISQELSALTDDSDRAATAVTDGDDDESETDLDDLTGHPDWDEDAEL